MKAKLLYKLVFRRSSMHSSKNVRSSSVFTAVCFVLFAIWVVSEFGLRGLFPNCEICLGKCVSSYPLAVLICVYFACPRPCHAPALYDSNFHIICTGITLYARSYPYEWNASLQTLVTRNAESPPGIASLAIFPVNAIWQDIRSEFQGISCSKLQNYMYDGSRSEKWGSSSLCTNRGPQ